MGNEKRLCVGIGERFDLPIEIFEGTLVNGKIAIGADREQLGEVNIQGGVFDAKVEGIIDHLDLEAFLGVYIWERSRVLRAGGNNQKKCDKNRAEL